MNFVPFKPPFRQLPAPQPALHLRASVGGVERHTRAEIQGEHLSALRSAIEDIRDQIGTRLLSPAPYDVEAALTRAAAAVGALAAFVNALVPAGDPHYRGGR